MIKDPNRFYVFLMIACIAGYIWLFINYKDSNVSNHNEFGVCMVKHIIHIPCPSCGSTRSILSLLNGEFYKAVVLWNPIGFILFIILAISPIWIAFDVVAKRISLWTVFNNIETIIKRKPVALSAFLLLVTNWIWTISKGL